MVKKVPRKSIWADLPPTAAPYAPPAVIRNDGPTTPEEGGGAPLAHGEKWDRILVDANAMCPENEMYAALLWVESRCVTAGLHEIDPWWAWHFRTFYESGKMVDTGRVGLRGAKSDSVCRALVAEVIFMQRKLEPGLVAACPVISRSVSEANDRTDTIVQILSACGLNDRSGKRDEEQPGSFTRSGGGFGARIVKLHDSQGHPVEFRIYPPSIAAAAGYTGIAGFADEVDLWGKDEHANPAQRVFEILFTRYLTQPKAKLHVMSASYFPKSAHSAMVGEGDTSLQRVARLGAEGARKDTESRARLAALLGANLRPEDRHLLLKPGDPTSVDIPCWVSNPIAPIEECYKKSKDNVRLMLGLFGGQVAFSGVGAASADEYEALAIANRRLCASTHAGTLSAFREDGLITVPGYGSDFKPIPRGRPRGL